jgi:hypothetical protein
VLKLGGKRPFGASSHVRDIVSGVFSEVAGVGVVRHLDPDSNLLAHQIAVHASAHKPAI